MKEPRQNLELTPSNAGDSTCCKNAFTSCLGIRCSSGSCLRVALLVLLAANKAVCQDGGRLTDLQILRESFTE